jgi:hypothetical protein
MDDVVKEEGELLEVGWGAGAPGGEGEGHEEGVRGVRVWDPLCGRRVVFSFRASP